MPKRKGTKKSVLLRFEFFGQPFVVYVVGDRHPMLRASDRTKRRRRRNDYLYGVVYYDDGEIYLSESLTEMGRRSVLAHEVQHLVENWAPLDHRDSASSSDTAEMPTDLLSKGWLMLIRTAPELVDYLRS